MSTYDAKVQSAFAVVGYVRGLERVGQLDGLRIEHRAVLVTLLADASLTDELTFEREGPVSDTPAPPAGASAPRLSLVDK